MNFKHILSFGLVVYLNCLVESIEFCKAFGNNGHRISYTIRSNGNDTHRFIDIIIKDKFWTLIFNEDISKLEFESLDSKTTLPLLSSGDFQLGLVIRKYKIRYLLLIDTNNWTASIGNTTYEPMSRSYLVKKMKIRTIEGKPLTAFMTTSEKREPNWGSNHGFRYDIIFFVYYNKSIGKLDANAFENFDMDGKEINVEPLKKDKWNGQMQFLTKSIGKIDLLDVIYIHNTRERAPGFILLFKRDSKLMWCWVRHYDSITDECIKGKFLVDCSSTLSDENENKSFIIIIVIFVFFILIFFIGIIGFIIFTILKKTEKETVPYTPVKVEKALEKQYKSPKKIKPKVSSVW